MGYISIMIAKLIISQDPKEVINKHMSPAGITNPHPDLLYMDAGQKLGIEQARKIKQFFSLKPYSLKGKVVILEDATKLTGDAQNSLLKTLEELTNDSLFILGADSDVNFLPTILSRCQIIRDGTGAINTTTDEAFKLMQMDLAGKFGYIEKCKDKHKLLSELTAYLRNREVLQAEEWASANVNIRAILEHLMLVCPTPK